MTGDENIIYRFKVALKGRPGLWRRIEIGGNQTLANFDRIIRNSFKLDTMDHLSEFYSGKPWYRTGYGDINPDGGGDGAKLQIDSLGLQEGSKIGYIHDFGTELHLYVTLESISKSADEGVKYPCIVSQNTPRHNFCVECAASGKKTFATQVCVDCTDEHNKPEYLCDDHAFGEKHEEHFIDDIVY